MPFNHVHHEQIDDIKRKMRRCAKYSTHLSDDKADQIKDALDRLHRLVNDAHDTVSEQVKGRI